MKILLTGFTPFQGVDDNPSQRIVEAIAAGRRFPDVVTAVLPVAYGAADDQLRALIAEHAPDVILSLGVALSRRELHLERLAYNLDDAKTPDNTGSIVSQRRIIDDGPEMYASSLPLDALDAALKAHSVPVAFSEDAGRFLCNHIFYIARHEAAQRGGSMRAGFIHVPPMRDADQPDAPGLPLVTMIAGIEACLEVLSATDE